MRHSSLPPGTKSTRDYQDFPSLQFSHKDQFPSETDLQIDSPYSLSTQGDFPQISATAWAVADAFTGRILTGRLYHQIRQIASITKMMTALVVLNEASKSRSGLIWRVKISKNASTVGGTSANLGKGESIQVLDLLYGLMLPSGNDAAVALAEFFGKKLLKKKSTAKTPMKAFVREMNFTAKSIGMEDTFYSNPHGMSTTKNKSNIVDIVKLAIRGMENPLFRRIVSASAYSCNVVMKNGKFRTAAWKNTNKLLGEGFQGVKTGVTPNAGPCLCAYSRRGEAAVITVVLNCRPGDRRWVEVPMLTEWAFSQFLS